MTVFGLASGLMIALVLGHCKRIIKVNGERSKIIRIIVDHCDRWRYVQIV